MPFAGNLRTLPLPDVLQTLNNIKATGVLRLRANAGSRDVVFNTGEIIGVGFLDKEGRDDLELRLTLLGIDEGAAQRLAGVTWYWNSMQARKQATRVELDELVHEQAREQLHNLFAWNQAEFDFDEAGPDKRVANELVARCLERPLSIDTPTLLLEAARQQDEWAELRSRIREETGAAAMGSQPSMPVQQDEQAPAPQDSQYHLYLDGEWRGPFPRAEIVGLVQTGQIAAETWSYDPQTTERRTLDQLLGAEARRITPDELDALRQAVKAAEKRLADERAGRQADVAEMRGLAGEVLRLARDARIDDPAIAAVVDRLAEVNEGADPSLIALTAETVVVSIVRHLREAGEQALAAAKRRAEAAESRIAGLEAQLAEAEVRSDSEREAGARLREQLAQAAADAAGLNQELERRRLDQARSAASEPGETGGTARVVRRRSEELERELGRMRAEHARLLNEVVTLQARLDEDRARHAAELEAARAIAGSLSRPDPDTERIDATRHDGDTERLSREKTDRIEREQTDRRERETDTNLTADAALAAEVERLRALLAESERRAAAAEAASGGGSARASDASLRRELDQARDDAARADSRARAAESSELRLRSAEAEAGRLAGELAQARERLSELEAERSRQERAAYEAARNNTELEVRLRELAARLADGEERVAAIGDLPAQLAEARRRAEELEGEAVRIREDLARVRDDASQRLDRARRRIADLRQRLRSARREAGQRPPAVPWASPATAAFPAAPPQLHAPVPWPSPATAAYTAGWAAPGQPAPGHAELPNASLRTTSGTFVPMPMPDESSAARPRVQQQHQHQPPEQQFLPHALPSPAPAPATWRGPLAWAAGAAAVLLAGAWIAGAIADTVPIAERAVLNGRLHPIQARIAGTLELRQLAPGTRIDAGAAIGRITNAEVDRIRLDALGIKAQAVATRIDTLSAQLRAAQSERDRRAAERPAATPPATPATAPEAAGQAELRAQLAAAAAALDEALAARIAELQAQLADQRQAQATALADIAAEQQRIEQLRSAEVVADIGGVVWRAERNGSVAAGREVAALLVPETLVLDAELPAGTDAAPGHRARVRFGGAVVDAVVEQVDPGAAELAGYALPAGRGGGRRVLLRVDDPRDLERAFAAPARVALLGPDPGRWRLWIAGLRL